MGQVSASSSITVAASPQDAVAAIADYATVRPKILSDHYSGYRVIEGGQGTGTVVEWALKATEKRTRNVRATITATDDTVTETDGNSSMVTTWTVAPADGGSTVTTTTSWTGAGGIGGFFEKTFAPIGLRKIQEQVLANLARELG
ncbi:SRPBCC family protein [Rhodococcus triatomae]|uniref:Polyketide cyclase / dehydrase and lipid transport n=1 Tax=Rhodococcus triatomae TaxID=300028 RepID=A0A1G8IBD8_9NOCA|nr:SRPBCC family protein [Rhodococcus triatomae]QNG21010.1 SRPBCC family protein [Rhodococcus triatomae]QNG23075.1 SRPBCC family protein [Rhodococcus triatomae]SDI16299.1 Polyketide cyclase / dehydrase and lipid transport [Rhodococcus triatomae]